MNISRIFILRPVATALIMLAVFIFGAMGYRTLAVSDLPSVDFPTIQVTASQPGASPETMAASVATPLEKEFSGIAGLDSMTSTSSLGTTRITLQFSLDRDIDAAALDVQTAITTAQRNLPGDMPSPPSFRKVNPADDPVLYLALHSKTMRLSDVSEYAEDMLAQRISMVGGVAQVQVYGSQKYAVRVRLDPEKLAARGIGVDEVTAAVRAANVNTPVGTVTGEAREYVVSSSGRLFKAREFAPIIVAWRGGAPVRLSEVAEVFDSVEQYRRMNWFNGQPSLVLAVQRQPGANTVALVQSIRNLLPAFRAQLPAAVSLDILYDRSIPIRESVDEVKFTLGLTVVLVVLVIFLFLRNVRATLIPSLALPLSIVGSFGIMYGLHFSLNNISLMALTLSVGFVVDDAIVMLENVVRHMEMGKPARTAALEGSREICFTIVSMTVSLAAVFLPVLFMGGVVGRLFHEFAVTICTAILLSGLVSLTLTPMLCDLMLARGAHAGTGRFSRITEAAFTAMLSAYESTLRLALDRRAWVMLFSLVLLGATGWMFSSIPKGFLPSEDTGQLRGVTEGDQGITFEAMVERQRQVMAVISRDPAIEATMSVVGAGGPNPVGNNGRMRLKLKPRNERDAAADQIIQRLRPQLAGIPGIRTYLQNPPPISIGGQSTKGLYQFTLQSPDTRELFAAAEAFELKARDLVHVQDVNSDLQLKNPQVNLTIDRDKASALGLTAMQIEDALSAAYGNREVSTIYASNNVYKVMMEADPRFQKNLAAMSLLYVRSAQGRLVSLDTLTSREMGAGPLTVNHTGQLPSVTVSFNLRPGSSLGQAVDEIGELARQTLPASVFTTFQGTAQAFQSSLSNLWVLLILSIVVIYIVLGILYESFIHPLTILSGLPSAGAGALATLMAFRLDLDIYGFVGLIMLVGIVKKNAIMMIDFALDAQREQGLTPDAAIFQGCLVRFRPIMMTTLAAIMGALPIALGFGAGAEARRPLGLAVVGGLLVSQLLTLYLTPVYYIYLDRLRAWCGGASGGREEGGEAKRV